MGKTLVIAEKPSVARDLSGALPGSFTQSKDKTHLVGDDYVITWAVGHLVGLAEPDAYDPKLKKWRFADLPIVPKRTSSSSCPTTSARPSSCAPSTG